VNVFTGMGGLIDHIGIVFKQTIADVEISNIADDGILSTIIREETVSPSTAKRTECLLQAAELAKPDLIVCTCSSVGEAADAYAKKSGVPVLRIDYPLVLKALETGDRIAVMATLRSTLTPTSRLLERVAKEQGKNIRVEAVLVDGAMAALRAGDLKAASELVLAAAKDLQKRNGALLMAQASFDLMRAAIQPELAVPMLVSPPICAEYIRDHFEK
jgi:hypothetical protein